MLTCQVYLNLAFHNSCGDFPKSPNLPQDFYNEKSSEICPDFVLHWYFTKTPRCFSKQNIPGQIHWTNSQVFSGAMLVLAYDTWCGLDRAQVGAFPATESNGIWSWYNFGDRVLEPLYTAHESTHGPQHHWNMNDLALAQLCSRWESATRFCNNFWGSGFDPHPNVWRFSTVFFPQYFGWVKWILIEDICFPSEWWGWRLWRILNIGDRASVRKRKQIGPESRSREQGRGWAQKSSVFRVWRFIGGPWPLYWIALPEEFLTKAFIHSMPWPRSLKRRFSSLISASSHPLPRTPFQEIYPTQRKVSRGPPKGVGHGGGRWKLNQVFSRFFKNPEKTRLKPGKKPG